MTCLISPFQRVKDWKAGDRIIVDGNPGKIRDIVQFKSPSGSGEPIASIGVEYDNEPGVIRLVDFDVHQLKNFNIDAHSSAA